MVAQETIEVACPGRGFFELTEKVQHIVAQAGIDTGICNVFVHHTSASLLITENADPGVRRDLEAWMQRLVPDGDPMFEHTAEGADDMPAHVRNVVTATSLAIPVSGGRCSLGTWQGLYLWEHRFNGHRRRVSVTVMGDSPDNR